MKLRTGDPWMSAGDYGRSLHALTVNLIVAKIEKALEFQTQVLRAGVVYADPDFAVLRGYGAEWMIHADHTYEGHPLEKIFKPTRPRGAGIELRLHGCDPDQAESAARRLGYSVLVDATDTAHGLRETLLMDADGYVWVPDVPTKS